jgi:hypothetical protein
MVQDVEVLAASLGIGVGEFLPGIFDRGGHTLSLKGGLAL